MSASVRLPVSNRKVFRNDFFNPSLPAIVSFSRYRLYKVFSTITKYLEFLLAFHLPVTDRKIYGMIFFETSDIPASISFMRYGRTPMFF